MFLVWADDQWLVDHAGETLKQKTDPDGDGGETVISAENEETADVRSLYYPVLLLYHSLFPLTMPSFWTLLMERNIQ